MKAIVIAEMDEKVFDELSNEKLSMHLSWDYDTMWVEKSKFFDRVILRPLPKNDRWDDPEDDYQYGYIDGFDDCLKAIAGETDERQHS